MKYAVKLNVNGTADIILVPARRNWKWYSQQIGCEFIETVYPRGLEEPYMMIVDEEGLLKDKPIMNFYASWLYETHKHGHPIVGDVLIMKQVFTSSGMNIGGLEKYEAEAIQRKAHDEFFSASSTVEKSIAWQLGKS